MRISSVRIINFKSVMDSGTLDLGPITLLVGRNNSGKSSVIRALHVLQTSGPADLRDIRYGADEMAVHYLVEDLNPSDWGGPQQPPGPGRIQMTLRRGSGPNLLLEVPSVGSFNVTPRPATEPENIIYPYLAGRKATAYEEVIDQLRSQEVRVNLSNLAAKVDRLADAHHPMHEEFERLVAETINLPLSAIASPGGKQVGMWVDPARWIGLWQMGDGVAQMLGLITQLCMADGHVFLVEELENDVHPEGLKALLRLIEERSGRNQFIISTHSNIVVRHLGAVPSTVIYSVSSGIEARGSTRLPTTTFSAISHDVTERVRLLNSLGYELSDFDLYDGWLILEEASAERLIRDYLAKWFAPALTRVRTVASRGTGDIERSTEALEKLVLFTHLQELYSGRIRVLVDNEPSGQAVIARLKQRFTSWPEDSFRLLDQPDFERYYPPEFESKVEAALALKGRQKREAKAALLLEVLQWIDDDEERARLAFADSAAKVIVELRDFERSLSTAGR